MFNVKTLNCIVFNIILNVFNINIFKTPKAKINFDQLIQNYSEYSEESVLWGFPGC